MKSKFCGIYLIRNNLNEKLYIGQSKNIFARWSEHVRKSFNVDKDNSILHKAFKKYDISNFLFQIIEICDESELDEKEKFYINLYQATKDNYNITSGGKGGNCRGSKNHNSKLTENDVYNIREQYKNIIPRKEVYKQYENIISINTFTDVWNGKTWTHIHMDVYTDEIKNKQRFNYDKTASHKSIQIIPDKEILRIRKLRLQGYKPKFIHEKYYQHVNRNTFDDVWYNRTFKHLKVEDDNGSKN